MKFRLATKQDLPKLETMFSEIVDNMNKSGICIWNEYYPYEEFENDIDNNNLWILVDNSNIISVIGLFPDMEGKECFNWKNKTKNAMYISRLGINVNYVRQGFAKKTLEFATKYAMENNFECIRLLVAEINQPAINLYIKNGFKQVEGIREEFSPTLNKTLNEFGFELEI